MEREIYYIKKVEKKKIKKEDRIDQRKGRRKKKNLSEVGFEPTPTYVDQKTRTRVASKEMYP